MLPLGKDSYPNDIDTFCSVTILSHHKRMIRKELSRCGVNQKTIYPGLEGVAKWIKSNIANYKV